MPISASDHLGISLKRWAKTGAFDPILDVDSRLFIDPLLLRRADPPEFKGVQQTIDSALGAILKLLDASKRKGDRFWIEAGNRLTFPEIPGLCIGYTADGTSGNAIGRTLRTRMLEAAVEIIEAGIKDPAIFELMGILEPRIGSDRISDMFARITLTHIARYSARVFADLEVEGTPRRLGGQTYLLPRNPHSGAPILLVPRRVLRSLPVATSWDEIDAVVLANAELRRKVNALIGTTWRKARRSPKQEVRRALLTSPNTFAEFVAEYRAAEPDPYDFEGDPAGQVVWYSQGRAATRAYPLRLVLPAKPTVDDVEQVVLLIGSKFKDLVENNKLHSLLYDSDGKPKHEEAAQLVFYGIADAYCEANELDLSRETNGGRGPVDFKVSGGYRSRVVAELKLNTNPRLVHGYDTQVREYQKAEKAKKSVLIVIDVGGPTNRIQELLEVRDLARARGEATPTVLVVDGKPKASASKYRRPREGS
jgi:hypothetical protein